MTGAIMQPTFNPWLGYFDLIDQSDIFVLYDDVQLAKRSWQIRNRIKTAQGELFLTIPIKKTKHRDNLLISEAEINNEEKWKSKHLKTLQQAYKKATHFDEVYFFVESHYNQDNLLLADFNSSFIKKVSSKIGLKTSFISSSELKGIEGEKDTRLAAICEELGITKYLSPQGSAEYIEVEKPGGQLGEAGIDVLYHNFKHPIYTQLYGEFMGYYGVLDLLFNEGFDSALPTIRMGRQNLIPSKAFRENFINK